MDVLYIPQLEDGDAGESPAAGRYRLLKRVPEEGCVALADRAVTRVEVASGDPLKLTVPPLVKGAVRDFFVRLVVTADEIPEVTFAAPAGETISFEDADVDMLKCEVGVNHFAFTETDEGVFIVNRKLADIDMTVEFDPCGGEMSGTSREYKLGAQYASLPKPTMAGHVFEGWFTAAGEGVKVGETDRCKTGVTKLYAHWHVYVDPFVGVICPAGDLTFHTRGDAEWFVDHDTFASAGGSARSGRIGDNGSTSLVTTVHGPGKLSCKLKVSSEERYDKLYVVMDGTKRQEFSGEVDWRSAEVSVPDGDHEIEFLYGKDGSCESGQDCAWVDDVVWTPGEAG